MSKKKKKSVPVTAPKHDGPMTIDMNRLNLNKTYMVPGFRTGVHMTEKDRPRKKDWKREYMRGKDPGMDRRGSGAGPGSFYSPAFLFALWVAFKGGSNEYYS